MIELTKLVRPNIQNMSVYSSARDEFKGKEGVFLDANENPYGQLNRYPDPKQNQLKKAISVWRSIPKECIFLGNGSDEAIDIAFRIFCEPEKDEALIFTPTYGMYEVAAELNNVKLNKVLLNSDFEINRDELPALLTNENLKLLFICSPNNPTGNTIERSSIEYLLQSFNGIVVLDEAYIDFSKNPSFLSELLEYKNLIILQTFSKAKGLAGARIGMAFASEEIISYFNKVKMPYNISELNQQAALKKLQYPEIDEEEISLILSEKEKLMEVLKTLPIIKKLYPSETNFLLVQVNDADTIYQYLAEKKLIVRNRSKVIAGCLRISIGTPAENEQLITALKQYNNG